MARSLQLLSPGGAVRRVRARLAIGPIALAAALGLAAVGCLTPPPIEEESREESGPVIDYGQVIPQDEVVIMPLGTDPDQTFRVDGVATDPDGDVLSHYWYLLLDETEEGVAPVTNFTSYFLRPCADEPPPRPNWPTDLPQFAFVEVDITDRPRLRGPDGSELPEPRTYPEDAHVVTIDWVLYFGDTECPPN